MKVKKIIPRKDHEVYFIPIPESLKPRMVRRFVFDALSELHPGFSATTRVDIQSFVFNTTRWYMATVIAGETLAEYQITHRGAALYTNTSILAHTKDFIHNAPVAIDDEIIGFDSATNKPISLPLEAANTSGGQYLTGKLDRIPSRHGVFNKNNRLWLTVAILTGIAVLIITPVAYACIKISGRESAAVIIERPVEQPPEITYMPPAISILANIAELFVRENGKIERWQFTEGADPYVVVQSAGISAVTAHAIFSGIEYMVLEDIKNINYIDGKPTATIVLSAKQDTYSLPVSRVFPDQDAMLIAAAELIGLLNNQRVVVSSETFPSADNNYESYTITYTVDDINFIRSLDIIEALCEKYSFRIKRLDIAINADKNIFTAICALTYSAAPGGLVVATDAEKHAIPAAFGYIPVMRKQVSVPVMAEPTREERTIIGSITDLDGSTIYFHDSGGKIQMRSGQ